MFDFLKSSDQPEDGAEKPFEFQRPKIGLALGSGVARGWAHIGVLRAMDAAGLKPDVIAGTSIGAVVGGAWDSGAMDPIENWARSLEKTSFFRFLNFKFTGGGLFGGDKLHELMTYNFGDHNFEDQDTPFIAVSCELMTGHEVWLRKGNMVNAIMASFALPGVFEPQHLDGRWLVDGALVNPVPVSVCRAMGAELVISVNLSEDIYGRARAEREGLMTTGKYGVFSDFYSDDSAIAKRAVVRQLLRHKKGAPSLFANMVASLNIVQNRLSRSRLAGDPPDISISPKCGHIGLMEFNRTSELIDLGHKAFEAHKDEIMDAFQIIGLRRNAEWED